MGSRFPVSILGRTSKDDRARIRRWIVEKVHEALLLAGAARRKNERELCRTWLALAIELRQCARLCGAGALP